MMRWLLPLLVLAFASPTLASAAEPTEDAKVKAFQELLMLHCLPGIMTGGENNTEGLTRLPRAASSTFLQGQPGTVWHKGIYGMVLVLHQRPSCQVIAKTIETGALRKALEPWFLPPNTPFRLIKRYDNPDGGVRTFHRAPLEDGSDATVVFSTRPVRKGAGVQALVTVARTARP